MRYYNRTCDYCGKLYGGRGENYCSIECRIGASRGFDLVALFDAHHEYGVPETDAYKAVKRFIQEIKPHCLYIGGDWWNFDCLSRFNKGKNLLLEKKRYLEDCEIGKEKLAELAPYVRRRVFSLGNHDVRPALWVEENPVMQGLIDVRLQGGLTELGFEIIPENDLFSIGKVNMTHGIYTNEFHAKKHALAFGDHIFYGHTHTHQTYMLFSRARRSPYISMSIGSLANLNPHWLRNKPNAWINQFLYIQIRGDGNFTPHPITIIDGTFSYGGEIWKA